MTKEQIELCLRGIQNIKVTGNPVPARHYKIEQAIKLIQTDSGALRGGYLGIKQYAHFGDQECDCAYGMGPTHGSIVFSIGRVHQNRNTATLGEAEVFLLEAVRDFGVYGASNTNLWGFLDKLANARLLVTEIETVLQNASIQPEYDPTA